MKYTSHLFLPFYQTIMALRKTYYDLKLKEDKLDSIKMPLKDVLDMLGWMSPAADIWKVTSILIRNYELNSSYSRHRVTFHNYDHIVLGFAIIINQLMEAVNEAKIYIEQCPRISIVGSPGPGMRGYQLDLMIRYYDDSDFEKFNEILNSMYTYSYMENDG